MLDFPNLPYLIDGDVKVTQSMAIVFYIGRKYNLMGNTPKDDAVVMMLCLQISDYREALNGLAYSPKGASAEERTKFVNTTLKDTLKKFDTYLEKQNTRFSVCNHPTMADFQIFEHFDAATPLEGARDLIRTFPHVKRLMRRVRELPELKEYIAKTSVRHAINNKSKYHI